MIEYFETVPIDVAAAVLGICQGIIRRRSTTRGPDDRPPKPRTRRAKVNDDGPGILQDGSTPERMR